MGFGEVASATIMFIAVISAATLLAFVFDNYANAATNSVNSRQQFIAQQLKTDLVVENVIYDTDLALVKVYVRNTGETSLKPNLTGIFIANERININSVNTSIGVIPDTDTVNVGIWDPKEILLIQVNQSISSSITHKAIIISQYGNKDEYEFSV